MRHVILLIAAVALVGCVTNDAVVVVDFDQLEGERFRYFKGKPFTGIAVSKWPNGQKKEERPYKKGDRHGLFTKWHPNGQKSEEFKMSSDHPVGRSTYWYDNGQKKSEIPPYEPWGRHGLQTEWHRNGQKKEESTYKKGDRWGLSTEWHENGQKKVEGTYFSDRESGLFTEWYENGQKAGEITYSNGRLISSQRWDRDGKRIARQPTPPPTPPKGGAIEAAIRKELKKPTGELTKADLEKVTRLGISDNQLTDVKGLKKLTKLKFLYLYRNPDLTKAQIAELQKALPKCRIFSNPKK
jgi:antitoxin component YwqK of YwqJK toxin-antitoxin module